MTLKENPGPEQIRGRILLWTGVVIISGIGVLLAVSALVRGRDTTGPAEPNRPAAKAAQRSPEANEATLSPAQQAKGQIVTAPLNSMSFRRKVPAYGTVIDPRELADSRSSYAGSQAKQESTQARLTASRENYTRARSLYNDNRSTSQKSLEQAQATWLSDQAQARAAEVALASQRAVIREQWGTVIAQWIEESSLSFVRLMDQQDVLIQITAPVGTKISPPPPNATIETPAGIAEMAAFVSSSPRTDRRIQGFSFFCVASAKDTGLLPGMNTLAYLPADSEETGVYVPASAVVWLQGRAWIYLQTSPNTFARRVISTDTPVQGGWLVRRGFSAGQKCVVRGAQLVLSQESRGQGKAGDED